MTFRKRTWDDMSQLELERVHDQVSYVRVCAEDGSFGVVPPGCDEWLLGVLAMLARRIEAEVLQ